MDQWLKDAVEKMQQWAKDNAEEIKAWMAEHPYQTAFMVVNGVVMFAPGMLSAPFLALLGWTATGPRALSFASAMQSTIGVIPARSVFAILQSAGMGGYGATVVNGVVRAGAAVRGIWGAFKATRRG